MHKDNTVIFFWFKNQHKRKSNVIDEKITRYKIGITLARDLSQKKYADQKYYDNLITRFEKFLKFYKDLKIWKGLSDR